MNSDIEMTKEFLYRIGHKPITLTAIQEPSVFSSQFDSYLSAASWAETFNKQGYKLYYSVNVMRRLTSEELEAGKRGGAADVVEVFGFPVDIDVRTKIRPASDKEREPLPMTVAMILDYLNMIGLGKPIIIDSGNGVQLVIPFKPRITMCDAKEQERVSNRFARFQAVLQQKFNTDEVKLDSVADLARVMALPGTLKWKLDGISDFTPERPNRTVKVLDWGDL